MYSEDITEQDFKAKMVEVAALGRQAEDFLNTFVGEHLLSKMKLQYTESLQLLVACDPEDSKAIRNAQNRIIVVRLLWQFLIAAINDGVKAMSTLRGEED